ncbi:dual E2 ubiquitin-conjugating enzyme/E3 ubiquitin-protein ligase BIRC6 isoform X2 [Epargyreus clarus]|uniref:dual E2 ubiquitin-conjugating enzyme/E3 ubiquitin-protein ligase BIRC6 isoform X2 n=1 Tax=Epargyreus clarus TaxID=520877 RepID=UPI003C2E32EB
MGDDSLLLREDGYIRMNFPVTSLAYHINLNILLVKTDVGDVHVLDVNSGVILQSSNLSADEGGTVGVEYVPGADRVLLWDQGGVSARNDYNGVLLLHTALQRPIHPLKPDQVIKIELVLSEAVLLYQCVQSLDAHSIEGLSDFINELKSAIDAEPVRKGVKAQKWSTVTISLPQSTLRLVTAGVVQELKGQNRQIPALAIASAVGQRASDLYPGSRDEDSRTLMYSEAERKKTFKRWPHMDYKWALPARMAQAGFYHQPSPSGDDRAMCFMCTVCLVCWEKSDEPWVEHERHSPNCPFVRGEYTHNVPISVTNATACAQVSPNARIISRGNTGHLIATGTVEGKVTIWKFDCGLKFTKLIPLSPYDSIFSGVLATDSNKVWSASLEKDTSTYGLELTAMAFLGMTPKQEVYPQPQPSEISDRYPNMFTKARPALICAVVITRTNGQPTDQPIKDDSSKALFDSASDKSQESVRAMNDQNEAKSNLTNPNRMLFLLTYDIFSSRAGSMTTVVQTSQSSGNSKAGGSKKVATLSPLQRADDANIYDEIYFQYSDEDTELPQCTNSLIDEQISNVINLNASSSKEDCKIWEPKKIIFTKHFKVLPPPPPTALLPELPESGQGSMLDFVGKITQLKSWKSGNLESVGTKLVDQTDAVHGDAITQYLNMTGQGPLEISDLKWYEGGEGADKIKVTTFGGSKVFTQAIVNTVNADGYSDSDQQQDDGHMAHVGTAVQCISLPEHLNLGEGSKITHLFPTEDKEHLLVVISTIDPEKVKKEAEVDADGDTKMDIDEGVETQKIDKPEAKAYFLLYKVISHAAVYALHDSPESYKELPYNESPVDLCLLPVDKSDQRSFATVGADGHLRLYSLPDFNIISEKRVPKGPFTSVIYCASVERLSVSTKQGMIYFYALNNGEKDSAADVNEDEFANIDFDMLQSAPRDEVCGPTAPPVIIANKPQLDLNDLETLISLTGFYGMNTTVPYSAVVPGFWCELSPAQRSRSDHQNNRSWRLQNTSSTWDEHVLELTLPYSVSLAHVEFGFTLHTANSVNLPIIQVTLLKQNLHGIGYKKDASFSNRSESPVHFSIIDADMSNLENPVNSEEYLQAHNAEILAGPLLLSSGLDLTQQSGSLILTSPRLYRARGRTFLIHIKTLFDPAKDIAKGPAKAGESNSKKSGFIGCDWLHQISITVRSSPHTDVPMERQQRIAMLESNGFLDTLFEIAIKGENDERKLALDLINWVISIRLARMRLAKSENDKDPDNPIEAQQLECMGVIEKHTEALLKHCILCANRSIAKKCVKIILIAIEGVKQTPAPWKSTFEQTVARHLAECVETIGACDSPGALKWLAALAQHCTPQDTAPRLVRCLMTLLYRACRCLRDRADPYHQLLRARFGLYGLPLERTLFASDVPSLGRSSSSPITYASVISADTPAPPPCKYNDYHLKDLLNLPPEMDVKTSSPSGSSGNGSGGSGGGGGGGGGNNAADVAWWAGTGGVGALGAGLAEAAPLHVTCHVASDGTKLEAAPARHATVVVSAHPADAHQLWSYVVKEGQMKQSSQDPDSLEEIDSSLMECDPQDRHDFSEDKMFKDQEQCDIPWAGLVTRPPQHTLLVERMHSGARRYIVLDLGHTVRLTDVIIPSCSDLVTLCIDIWTVGEETDCAKLAFATDIATKHLVLTDIQPPPLCRYMKITTIGRYGMSAMKCKIPLGWFYGEIAEINNVPASLIALNALREDLTCRFRLATGKLMDLLNPYLDLYNGNAAHMMAYLGMPHENDPKVVPAYQECIDLQQQIHNCNNIIKRLLKTPDCNPEVLEALRNGQVTADELLERASTDKLRVIVENIVDMLLHFGFQMEELWTHPAPGVNLTPSPEWCAGVTPAAWESAWGGAGGAALAALLSQLCADATWWGDHLVDALHVAIAHHDAPPLPIDRCLIAVMYMARKSMYAHGQGAGGVAQAFAARSLALLRDPAAQPALLAALLTVLASVLDAALPIMPMPSQRQTRWDWVVGGRAGVSSADSGAVSPRTTECKLHRRKLHKKLLHQMQELDAARRGVAVSMEEQQTRMAMVGKRAAARSEPAHEGGVRLVSSLLASQLAHALAAHLLSMDGAVPQDDMLLAAKVIGRLCAMWGGSALLEPSTILGLARLAVTLPPWPRHAVTTLLQDLVEYEHGEAAAAAEEWGAPGTSRVIRVAHDEPTVSKTSPRSKGTVADVLADSFGLAKSSNSTKPKINAPASNLTANAMKDVDFHLGNVAESDDSEPEDKAEQHFLDSLKKLSKSRPITHTENNTGQGNISCCVDARLESGAAAASEAAARRVLVNTGAALPLALRAQNLRGHLRAAPDVPPPPAPAGPRAPRPPAPQGPIGTLAPCGHLYRPCKHVRHTCPHGQQVCSVVRPPPPLAHTLYDVFRHLALEFNNQLDCTFMENVVSLWLTLNGSAWGGGGTSWSLAVPADAPRVRLASDTVFALLKSLTRLDNITLRCWVLSMQALAWIASLPLCTEGSAQTMGRVILECEHFVPALVKFVSIDVSTDGSVVTSEPYLGGGSIGGGAGATAALQSVLSRVVMARGSAGAVTALRALAQLWLAPWAHSHANSAMDLHATLLRAAHSLLPALAPKHLHQGLPLIDAVATASAWWVRSACGSRAEGGGEARLSGLIADVLAGGGRRAPLRRAVLAQLLHYCRKLMAVPLPPSGAASPPSSVGSPPSASCPSPPSASQSATSPSPPSPGTPPGTPPGLPPGTRSGLPPAASPPPPPPASQTDESKAQAQDQQGDANVEDERKQQAPRPPTLADTVLQQSEVMQKFYKTLSLCDGMNTLLLNSGMGAEPPAEYSSVKEEVFWLVAQMPSVASNPALMVPSLIEFLRKDEVVNLSQAMQLLIIRLLEKPEALQAFIDAGGLELAIEKLTACHQAGPSGSQGLVSSLMNHLKLPPQLINLSTAAATNNKKSQPLVIETTNGLVNIAPLCTVSCGNPTAQAADVLLGGAGGAGPCAARRVRAAAWSYHFYSADDASLALTLTLPYAARLHEVHLQPHLTSLATCPGAVGVEAGCGGTLAPLGPPQHTAGMTFIRLAVTRPVVCTTVQLRLYKPRDSPNMGLLQLKLLVAPAFAPPHPDRPALDTYDNNWACVVAACSRARLEAARWGALSGGGVRALCAAVLAQHAPHAHHALLNAAAAAPQLRPVVLTALLDMDVYAHAHAFQTGVGGGVGAGGVGALCAAVRALCIRCASGCADEYVRWLPAAAERWLRERKTPSAALLHTLAEVLWTLKEEKTLENLEELMTDDLFELVYTWVKDVPEASLLKKALDAILCSMCYIRPQLFRLLLEQMEIPTDLDESMECLTDDTKVSGVAAAGRDWDARGVRGWQLATLAAAAMSPAATLRLLHSPLPAALVVAIAVYSETKLESIKQKLSAQQKSKKRTVDRSGQDKDDVATMKWIRSAVRWCGAACAERRLKDWLGSPAGRVYWRPLLAMLCHPRPHHCSWEEGSQYAHLEEETIRLFAELTVCHPSNQKLFAHTLHGILENVHCTGGEGITGFTRALILRLVLSGERGTVALRWAGAPPAAAPAHPAARAHALLTLPLATTVRALLAEHRPPMPVLEDSSKAYMGGPLGAASVLRSASDTALVTVAEAWELSLAAASASKDKRVKDVKNSLKQQTNKKRQNKANSDAAAASTSNDATSEASDKGVKKGSKSSLKHGDDGKGTKGQTDDVDFISDYDLTRIRVKVPGLEGYIPLNTTLAQLTEASPHEFGPHLTLILHLNNNGGPSGEAWAGATGGEAGTAAATSAGGGAILREFGACGGLALVAARLPRPHAAPAPPPAANAHLDLDWVKLDDPYEEVVELGVTSAANAVSGSSGGGAEGAVAAGVPSHALVALALLLKLPGYAAALLDEGARAVHLLRLLLGVAHDEEGRSIVVSGNGNGTSGGNGGGGANGNWSLGTLPFRVVARLLEAAPCGTDDGRALRRALLQLGAVRLVLACLAVFTHHKPTSNENSQMSNGGKGEDKSQLYWAKGTGFGTGSTQQSWNVEQALVRQRLEEEHVTVLLQVLASYMNPGERWPPEESASPVGAPPAPEPRDLPAEFVDLVAPSSLVPAICSYLRNDSVLDMSRHIPLYVCVLRCARALHALRAPRLAPALRPLPRLLHTMSRTTNSYATKLRMSKKNIFGKMTYSQRFSSSSNSELSEEDEGLASLIADIQATSALMWQAEGEAEAGAGARARAAGPAGREARYIELMRTMQFETFEMIVECGEGGGFRFTVPYHFEGTVRAAGERTHPARMKRLAQEAATLATSLPLSYSSSVFVRTDTDRLDVMKVLITGPSDTPYANGCFILDVYFPAEYPAVPMLINLETTGRHSVRFNPNLYNDGKVCLSVLNTWHGRPEEKWNAHTSSFLQVLVSIQSLILVPEPYFNEPGYERSRGTRVGNSASLEYNSNIYQACVRWAMLDHLRSPEPCFKEVIQTHFWIKRNEIMQTVANWITELEGQSGDERTQRSIQLNLMALKRHYVKLQEELGKLPVPAGLEELDEPFTLPAAPPAASPPPAPAPPTADEIDHDMEKIVSQVLD